MSIMTPKEYVKKDRKITGKPIFLNTKAEKAFLQVFGTESKQKYDMVPGCERWCTNRVALAFKHKKYLVESDMVMYYDAGEIHVSFVKEPIIIDTPTSFSIGASRTQAAYTTFFRKVLKLLVARYNILVAIATARVIANNI